MIVIASALAVLLAGQAAPRSEAADLHAERCYAHVMLLIEEAAEDGPVAGPSWFIRDWWEARLPSRSTPERKAAVRQALLTEEGADLTAFAADRAVCIEEAIDAGAVPGM